MRAAVVCLVLLAGCGPAKQEEAFDPAPSVLPNLQIYFARSIPVVERFDWVDVAREKQDTLNTTILSLIAATTGAFPPPHGPRRVFVYDKPLLRGPYSYDVQGWVDLDNGNAIHVTRGTGNVSPEFLRYLTQSAYYPYELHRQKPTYVLQGQTRTLWQDVEDAEAAINAKWLTLRQVP